MNNRDLGKSRHVSLVQESSSSVTRRQFLLKAGGLAEIGGVIYAGYFRDHHTNSEKKIQNQSGETNGILNSEFMHSNVGWTIAMPQSLKPAELIIFCLHGFDNNHRMAFDDIDVPAVANSIGLNAVVAAVDGGADNYWHKRENGTDAMSMLLYEFMPLVQSKVGKLKQAIIGWSMGGYGALLAAEKKPQNFVAVSPASPALWLLPGETAPGAFDSPQDFYNNDMFTNIDKLNGKIIAIACGLQDPFYNSTKLFTESIAVPHLSIFLNGGHDSTFWNQAAPLQLKYIGQRLNLL